MDVKVVNTHSLVIGDVVMSSDFAYCTSGSDGLIFDDLIKLCAGGKAGLKVSLAHVDFCRATRKFIVTQRTAKSAREIIVKKLGEDGSYDEKGQEITFSPYSDFHSYLKQVTLVGEMRQIFVPMEND